MRTGAQQVPTNQKRRRNKNPRSMMNPRSGPAAAARWRMWLLGERREASRAPRCQQRQARDYDEGDDDERDKVADRSHQVPPDIGGVLTKDASPGHSSV